MSDQIINCTKCNKKTEHGISDDGYYCLDCKKLNLPYNRKWTKSKEGI